MSTNSLIGRAKREITDLVDGENEINYIKNDEVNNDQTGDIETSDSETRPGLKGTVDIGASEASVAMENHRETEDAAYGWLEREKELRDGNVNYDDGGNRDNRITRNEERQNEDLQEGNTNEKINVETNKEIAKEIKEVLDNEKRYEGIANMVLQDERSDELKDHKKTPIKYDHTDTNIGGITKEIKDAGAANDGLVNNGLTKKVEDGSVNNRANEQLWRIQGEVDSLLKACEEGMEDKHKCESLKSLIRSKQKFPFKNKRKDNKVNSIIVEERQREKNSNENSNKKDSNDDDRDEEDSNDDDEKKGEESNENDSKREDNNKDDSNGENSNQDDRNGEERNENDKNGKYKNGEGSSEDDSLDDETNRGESSKVDSKRDDSNEDDSNGEGSSEDNSLDDEANEGESNEVDSKGDDSNEDDSNEENSNQDDRNGEERNENDGNRKENDGEGSSEDDSLKDETKGGESNKVDSIRDDSNEDYNNGEDSNQDDRNREERDEDDRNRKDNNGEGSSEVDSTDDETKVGESNKVDSIRDDSIEDYNNGEDSNQGDRNREERGEDDGNRKDNNSEGSSDDDSTNDEANGAESNKVDRRRDDSIEDDSNGENSNQEDSIGEEENGGESNEVDSNRADSNQDDRNGEGRNENDGNRKENYGEGSSDDDSIDDVTNGGESNRVDSNRDNSNEEDNNGEDSNQDDRNTDDRNRKDNDGEGSSEVDSIDDETKVGESNKVDSIRDDSNQDDRNREERDEDDRNRKDNNVEGSSEVDSTDDETRGGESNEVDSIRDDSIQDDRNGKERNGDDRDRKDNNGEGSSGDDSIDKEKNGGESNEDESNRDNNNDDGSNGGDNYVKENNTNDSDDLSKYIKACKEGKMDQEYCDSLNSFLHQRELSISNNIKGNMKGIATRDYKMIDEDEDEEDQDEDDNEVENDKDDSDGASRFLRRCEEGLEDNKECESFISLQKSQKEFPINESAKDDIIDSKKIEHSNKAEEDNSGNYSDEGGGNEVSRYLKECEEGEEDQEDCESFKSYLKSQRDIRIREHNIDDDRNEEGNNIEESKEINNKEGNKDEILTYLKECEEGKEDPEECESFKSYLKSQKQFAIYLNTKAEIVNTTIKHIGMKREDGSEESDDERDSRETDNGEEDSNEVSKFLKGCEEGTEDDEECELIKSFLKSKKEPSVDNFKNNNTKSHKVRGNGGSQLESKGGSKKKKNNEADRDEENREEKHRKEILLFLKGCDEGRKDQEDCESLIALLESLDGFSDDNNNDEIMTSNIKSKKGANSDEENSNKAKNNGENNNELGEDVEDSNQAYIKEILLILDECEEGKKDQNYCESLKSLLVPQQKFTIDNKMKNDMISSVKTNSKVYKEDDEKDNNKENDIEEEEVENNEGENNRKDSNEEGIVEELIASKLCEEGTENKHDCDLLKSILKSSKEFPIDYDKKVDLNSIQARNTSKNEYQNIEKDSNEEQSNKKINDKMSLFLKNCEEGKGNQKECKSFKSLLKSQQQFSIDNNKKEDKTYKVTNDVNKNEEDSKKISSFLKRCEDGKEEEGICAIFTKIFFSRSRAQHVTNDEEHEFFKQSNELDGKRRSHEQTKTFNFEKDCKGGNENYDICKLYLDLVHSREKLANALKQKLKIGIEDRNDLAINDKFENQEDKTKDTRDSIYDPAVDEMEYLKRKKSEIINEQDVDTRDTLNSNRKKARIRQHLQETSHIKKVLRNLRKNIYQLRKLLDIDVNKKGKEELPDYEYEYGSGEEDKVPNREKRQTNILETKRSASTVKNELGLDKRGEAIAKGLTAGENDISKKVSEPYWKMNDKLVGGSKLKPGKETKKDKEIQHFHEVLNDVSKNI